MAASRQPPAALFSCQLRVRWDTKDRAWNAPIAGVVWLDLIEADYPAGDGTPGPPAGQPH